MGRVASMDMSTTGSIRTMAIMDRCRAVEQRSSTTSKAMKPAMDVEMSSRSRTMKAAGSMRCLASMVGAAAESMVAVADTARISL